MNLLITALLLVYLGYSARLAKIYYQLWSNDPQGNRDSRMLMLLFALCFAWPIVVPISYLEFLQSQRRPWLGDLSLR